MISLLKMVRSTFFRSITSPEASSVEVEYPIVTSPSYAFPASVMYSATFVAFPIQIGNTPVTSGSSVPVCPILFIFKIFLSLKTQSCEVIPFGLKRGIIPSIIYKSFPICKKWIDPCLSTFLPLLFTCFHPVHLPFHHDEFDEVECQFYFHNRSIHQIRTEFQVFCVNEFFVLFLNG